MTDVLGYQRYGAQGGDYGAFTASRLGYALPGPNLIGIHINLIDDPRDRPPPPNPTEEETRYFAELADWLKEETGYQSIQGTKPQTLAYGLTDSPAGLAAWIAEKFRTWTDNDGDDRESVVSRDHLLAEYLAVLVHRRDRLIVLALLCSDALGMADPQRTARSMCRPATARFRRKSSGRHARSRSRRTRTSSAGRRCRKAATSRRWNSRRRWRRKSRRSSETLQVTGRPGLCPGPAKGRGPL